MQYGLHLFLFIRIDQILPLAEAFLAVGFSLFLPLASANGEKKISFAIHYCCKTA